MKVQRVLARYVACLAPSSLILAAACDDPLVERQTITELRVVGARVEPAADPERATLLPGESARVHWLVADADGRAQVSFVTFACPAVPSSRGVPSCAEDPSAERIEHSRRTAPSLDLTVPSGSRLLLGGVFCGQGDVIPRSPFESSFCDDPASPLEIASYVVPISDQPPFNRHPTLAGSELLLAGQPWPSHQDPAEDPDGGAFDACASDGPPRLGAGELARVTLELPPEARERLRDESDAPRSWELEFETLQISYLSTAGRFERPFTTFAGGDTRLLGELDYRAPADPGSVVVYFVVRDLRGGVSWLERSICVE